MQTIAAPDGRSQQNDRPNPPIPPSVAMIQPMSRRARVPRATVIPQTAGTIR